MKGGRRKVYKGRFQMEKRLDYTQPEALLLTVELTIMIHFPSMYHKGNPNFNFF